MAITRSQQAKQMLREGGRIGLKKGSNIPDRNRGQIGSRTKTSSPKSTGPSFNDVSRASDDDRRQTYSAVQTQTGKVKGGGEKIELGGGPGDGGYEDSVVTQNQIQRAQDAVGLNQLESLYDRGVGDSGLPGVTGAALDFFEPFRTKTLRRNIDFYRNDPRTRKARLKYGETLEGYQNYMRDRSAGNIDAAGNTIMGQDDDDDQPIIPIQTGIMTQDSGITDQETDTTEEEPFERALAFRADGGPIGGIMDLESGRQMYFLGKLVKKATRAVKKIAKSPIGKAAILGGLTFGIPGVSSGFFSKGLAGTKFGLGAKKFLTDSVFGKVTDLGIFGADRAARTGGILEKALGFAKSPFGLITAASAVAGALTPAQEDQAQQLVDNTGIDIKEARNAILQAAKENYAMDVRARGFKADGGIMRAGYQEGSKEPVAKKTMPLLDMGGKEMDLREDGGFVPIGRMEKADDVPARLSKNEFVFTADAVRNAGEGDIDKGAEVMYNMMKNLEAGGEVSEESQGLEGARRMFQTSQRLEEVL